MNSLEWLGITMEHTDIPKDLIDKAYAKAEELRRRAIYDFDTWLAEHGLESYDRTLVLLKKGERNGTETL